MAEKYTAVYEVPRRGKTPGGFVPVMTVLADDIPHAQRLIIDGVEHRKTTWLWDCLKEWDKQGQKVRIESTRIVMDPPRLISIPGVNKRDWVTKSDLTPKQGTAVVLDGTEPLSAERAAEVLGIDQKALRRKLRKYGDKVPGVLREGTRYRLTSEAIEFLKGR